VPSTPQHVTVVEMGGATDPTIVTGSADMTVRVWDLRVLRGRKGAERLLLEGHKGGITCIHRDWTQIASGSTDTTVKVWDGNTGECLRSCYGHISGVSCVARVDDSTILSGSWDSTLRLWQLQ
jgi:F-box and WD-40 domain protein 1/11